jgi:hypothetical protein
MRRISIRVFVLIVFAIAFAIVLEIAPENSAFLLGGNVQEMACLSDIEGNCLVLPAVSGTDINNQRVHFPDAFTKDYYLLVMPFDRDQQTLAITWLPLFQELAAEHENIYYFNIAALPDLNSAIRLLVVGGLSATVQEAAVRSQVVMLFLEDQQGFLETVAIDDIGLMQVFVVDSDGVLLYRDTGEYDEAKSKALRNFIVSLES